MPAELILNDWEIQLIENGQVVQSEKLRLPYPKEGRILGVLHDEGKPFPFLAFNQTPMNVSTAFSVQTLSTSMLPEQSWVYRNLDVLALGGKQVQLLNARQVEAIKEWIRMGGIAIISAGPGQDGVMKPFSDLLPVEAGKSGQMDLREGLRPYAGDRTPPDAKIGVYNREWPLFVAKECGSGVLLFANYDVTAEPLASWQYNVQVWQNVMMRHGGQALLDQRPFVDQMTRPMLELSKRIPGVHTPSPLWILALWGGYVLLVAPLTYLIVKRLDRRQWAWGFIPAIAILVAVGTFAVGVPLVVKTNTSYAISEISILDEKWAQVRTASTFLSVDQDQYAVVAKPQIVALPLSLGKADYEPDGVTKGTDTLSFQNVPYLTPRQAIGLGMLRDAGQFSVSLSVHGDRLQGKVKNDTAYALDASFIEIGLQRIPLGSIPKGEEKRVDMRLEPLFMPRQPHPSDRDTAEGRIRQLQEDVLQMGRNNQVRIVGFSSEPLPLLTMREPHLAHYWNVIHQTVRLQPDALGVVTYPYGMLPVDVYETAGDFGTKSPYLWEMGKGSITFELKAGEAQVKLDRLTVMLDHSSYRPFQIEVFHQKSGKWKALRRGQRLVLEGNLAEYLTPKGSLLLRFSHSGTERLSLPMPFFQAEGSERKW